MRTKMSGLEYKPLNSNYFRAILCNVELVIHARSGFVKVDDLAANVLLYDKQIESAHLEGLEDGEISTLNIRKDIKSFAGWSELSSTVNLVRDFCRLAQREPQLLFMDITRNVVHDINGLYVHPYIALEYIRWLSPFYALYAQIILFRYQCCILVEDMKKVDLKKIISAV